MVCADLNEGTFKENAEIAREVAGFHPYGEWLQGSQRLADLGSQAWLQEPQMGPADALKLQVSLSAWRQPIVHSCTTSSSVLEGPAVPTWAPKPGCRSLRWALPAPSSSR